MEVKTLSVRPEARPKWLKTRYMLVGSALLLSACSDSDKQTAQSSTSNTRPEGVTTSLPPDTCTYSEANPLSPVQGGKGRVFAYCFNEDPLGETGVYRQPEQIEGTAVGTVPNDTLVDMICATEGQAIQDSRGQGTNDGSESDLHDSKLWVKIQMPDGKEGFIPEAWLGFIKDGSVENC